MNIKDILAIADKVRFFIMRSAKLTEIADTKFNKEENPGFLSRALKSIAQSRVVSFLNSKNVDYIINLAAAATVFGTTTIFGISVSAYSMGIIPFAIIVGSVAASIVINGNQLHAHKKMVNLHKTLTSMLTAVEKNKELENKLTGEQKNILNQVIPDGLKTLKEAKAPPKRKPITMLGVSTFRGVFSTTTLISIAAAAVAMNPWAIGMTSAGWFTAMIGLTDKEKMLYEKRLDFKDEANAAKDKLNCYTITDASSAYIRIKAERALLKALNEGKGLDECTSIYQTTLESAKSPIKKESMSESLSSRANCSLSVLKNGFSSINSANLYELPDQANASQNKAKNELSEGKNLSLNISNDGMKRSKSFPVRNHASNIAARQSSEIKGL